MIWTIRYGEYRVDGYFSEGENITQATVRFRIVCRNEICVETPEIPVTSLANIVEVIANSIEIRNRTLKDKLEELKGLEHGKED